MRTPILFLGTLLCSVSAPSLAQGQGQDQDQHFYLGVDLGQARIHRINPGYTTAPGANARSFGGKLRFGWQLSRHWSLEAGYTDFGDYDSALMYAMPTLLPVGNPAGSMFAAGDFSTSVKGFDVSAAGIWPLGETFYLSATAGLMRREMKSRHDRLTPGLPSPPAKDGDLAALYGIGFGFRLSKAWDLGVNWAGTSNLEGDFEFLENESDPAMLSVGVRYSL